MNGMSLPIRRSTLQTASISISILFGLILSGCNNPTTDTVAPTSTPIPTARVPRQPTYTVSRGLVTKELNFLSRIQPIEDEQLAFEVDGRVSKTFFKSGDGVQAGAVLAELDTSDLKNQIQQGEVEYSTSQLVLSRTLSTFTETLQFAQVDLSIAQLRYQQAQAKDFSASIALNQQEIVRAQKLVADANTGLNSARNTPADRDMIPGFEKILQDAQINLSRAQANLQDLLQAQKQHQFDISIMSKEVERQRLNVSKIKNSIDPNLERAVEVNRLTLERLQAQLGRAQIIATFDGKITAQRLTIGGNVRALEPVIVVAKPGGLEAAAELSTERLQDLSTGMPVSITLNNVPGKTFIGEIRRMPPTGGNAASNINADKSLRISVKEIEQLKDGDLARCNIVTARKESALWLPPQAIRNFQGRRFVVVKDTEGERRADVKLGLQGEDRVEVLSGVLEGQVVIAP